MSQLQPPTRAGLRPYDQLPGKPRARESQPPLLSSDPNFEVSKPTKQFQPNFYAPKAYKAYDARQGYSLVGESSRSSPPHPYSESQTRQAAQISPRPQASDWSSNRYSNPTSNPQNRSLPVASNKIDKAAYLKCNEQIRSGGDYYRNEDIPIYEQPITSYKAYGEVQPEYSSRQPHQSSPTRKVPRMSEPGFPTQDSEFTGLQIMPSTSAQSPVQNSRTDSRFGQPHYQNADLFKKQKDITNSHSTLPSYRSMLRKSEFRVSDFVKGKELGNGKFGTVEVVKHRATGFVCALKTVPKAIIKEENIVGQFTRELKIQSVLDHPNITKLYGFFEDKDYIYLLLELGSEGQLYRIIKQHTRVSENTCVFIMKQICEALRYLHSLNILHRDIKPENIVMTYGNVKLCDFGWAVNKTSGELRSTFCGTPLYVSPEILKGHQYDEKIDIWSVGILTYELLVGDIPFQITSDQELVKIIKDDIVFPKDIQLSEEAKDFILKILKKNPEDRLKIDKLLDHPFLQRNVQLHDTELS